MPRLGSYKIIRTFLLLFSVFALIVGAQAQGIGANGKNDLMIAQRKTTTATIIVSADAGKWEKQAALDLQKYIAKMSGAKPKIADTTAAISAALSTKTPQFILGRQAIQIEPSLQKALDKVAKKNPFLRADAIVLKRVGNRIFLAGTGDEAHYYAVSLLLQNWGCRWYLPGELGECIPNHETLSIGKLDFSYAPPFEIRRAINRQVEGLEEWNLRNFISSANTTAHMGSLHNYIQDIVPEGKTVYNVPLAADETARHIAEKIAPSYAAGVENIPLAPFTQEYSSDSAEDAQIKAGVVSKYQNLLSSTDALMLLYNKIARILRERYPDSKTKLVGMAMQGAYLPPQRAFQPAPNLMIWLLPVDVDPNHAIGKTPSRTEWGEVVSRWSQVMNGRVAIYDYEEAMLVWRDLPNPRGHVFGNDFKQYARDGILGFSPETRGSLAVNFLNVFLRAQLMWDPDADVENLQAEFHTKFYGPAAPQMATYGAVLDKAWRESLVTEHEHFIAPAIYTPPVVEALRSHIEAAEATLKGADNLYSERVKMARLGFNVLDDYMKMVRAAATEANYETAVVAGKKGLASELALAQFRPELMMPEQAQWKTLEPGGSVAQWPGEVVQYQELARLQNGEKGALVAKLPLEWAFRRDPHDTGLASGFAYNPVDLSYWKAHGREYSQRTRRNYPTAQWEMLRTDLYIQAQGVLHSDGQSYTGFAWYQTKTELSAAQAQQKIHLMFPGLFNECWLYINGVLVAHRPQNALWALNDYAFEWDADLTGQMKPGANSIVLRANNSMYMGGIFRRPFLYQPAE